MLAGNGRTGKGFADESSAPSLALLAAEGLSNLRRLQALDVAVSSSSSVAALPPSTIRLHSLGSPISRAVTVASVYRACAAQLARTTSQNTWEWRHVGSVWPSFASWRLLGSVACWPVPPAHRPSPKRSVVLSSSESALPMERSRAIY